MVVKCTPLGAIPSIRDGMDYVRAAAAVPLHDVAYMQFTDALVPEFPDRMTRESLHRRAVPGEAFWT